MYFLYNDEQEKEEEQKRRATNTTEGKKKGDAFGQIKSLVQNLSYPGKVFIGRVTGKNA